MDALCAYAWPGNIRELANVLERAIILSPGSTLVLHDVLETTPSPDLPAASDHSLERVERAHILAVLEACQWRIKGDDTLRPAWASRRARSGGACRSSGSPAAGDTRATRRAPTHPPGLGGYAYGRPSRRAIR